MQIRPITIITPKMHTHDLQWHAHTSHKLNSIQPNFLLRCIDAHYTIYRTRVLAATATIAAAAALAASSYTHKCIENIEKILSKAISAASAFVLLFYIRNIILSFVSIGSQSARRGRERVLEQRHAAARGVYQPRTI